MRKELPGDKRNNMVSLRMPEDLVRKAEAEGMRQGTSRSDIIRKATHIELELSEPAKRFGER